MEELSDISSFVADVAVVLLAQTESLSGGAGWVGAGLLGAVLFWLLVIHLPSKDKQLKELLEGKDKVLEAKDQKILEVVATFRAESKDIRTEFREALNVIEIHADKRMTEVIGALRAEFERLNEIMASRQAVRS